MKSLILIPALFLLQSYRPFAQEGSVDTDNEAVEERMEKAQRNEIQEERAEKVIKEEQQSNEEMDRNLHPDILLEENQKKEGAID
ncbi:MAG: hypothetical protein V4598_04280 [Bdellovibrionota bacterium]